MNQQNKDLPFSDSEQFMASFENQLAVEPAPDWYHPKPFEIPWGQLAAAALVAMVLGIESSHFQAGVLMLLSWLHRGASNNVLLVAVGGLFAFFSLVDFKNPWNRFLDLIYGL